MTNIILGISQGLHIFIYGLMLYLAYIYPEIVLLYYIPIWYLTYIIYDDCILNMYENTLGKKDNENNPVHEWIKKNLFTSSYISPILPFGGLLITCIICVYSLKLKKLSNNY
jgi:hypothetical protein